MLSKAKVRFGMVGGGEGAFIGGLHRTGAAIAGNLELVAGALSSEPARARRSGLAIGLTQSRCYGSYQEMIARELALPERERIEAVAIVTPNHMHAPPAVAALEAGLHVICDKPLADTLENALSIERAGVRAGKIVAITHTYTGYPMVRQARELVTSGALGAVRRVLVQYTQDWLAKVEDVAGNKQAEWRADPQRAGEGGAIADIGTHAFNLVQFVTGERVTRVCADMGALAHRVLDDDGACLFRLNRGGRGVLVASQVCAGDANNLRISVYCDEAGIHWAQEEPNELRVGRRERPTELWRAGSNVGYLAGSVREMLRTPTGHPEGYLEAFANLYQSFAEDVRKREPSKRPGYATASEALDAMRSVRAARRSNAGGGVWVEVA